MGRVKFDMLFARDMVRDMKLMGSWLGLVCGCWLATALVADVFIDDPDDPLLQQMAQVMQVDESGYGSGPMLEAGRTLHVSPAGSDGADGMSPGTAWRTLYHAFAQLRAGDTLWVGEGTYFEPRQLVLAEHSGHAGSPIEIRGSPGARVIVTGARHHDNLAPHPVLAGVYMLPWTANGAPFIWQADNHVELSYGGILERVAELPATFYHNPDEGMLYVRYVDDSGPDQAGIRILEADTGLTIRADYILVSGLSFSNYAIGIAVEPGASHVSIEDCIIFATHTAGIRLSSAQFCLVKGNVASQSGTHGALFMHNAPRDEPDLADNLIIGNHFHSSRPTQRDSVASGFAIHHWNGSGLRNHIVDNLLSGTLSLWYKPMHRGVVIQGNVMTGAFSGEGTRTIPRPASKEDAVVVRGNTLLGNLVWSQESWGPGGPGGDWADELKGFVNNLHKPGQRTGFADLYYNDYRLQEDSPLRIEALGGGLRGAQPRTSGEVYFVDGSNGDDDASGLSIAGAWQSLAAASQALQAGDTLYVLPGKYDEVLLVYADGRDDAPVTLRAHGGKGVYLPGIEVYGSNLILAGFAVTAPVDDAVRVTGSDITLKNLLLTDYTSAGVRVLDGRNLTLLHMTLVGQGIPLVVEEGSGFVAVRDSILVAGNADIVTRISAHRGEFYASHNLYSGTPAVDPLYDELNNRWAHPVFTAADKGDYTLQWDSPGTHLALFGESAGARSAQLRPILITAVEVTGVQPDSAVVLCQTPEDDSRVSLRYRKQGARTWESLASPEMGTVHGLGLQGLQPDTVYEYMIVALGRRGGEATTPVETFRTAAEMPPPRVYHVSPHGDDRNDGLSPRTAWRTPRRASHVVAPGDTVLFAPGDYHHAIVPLRGGMPGLPVTFKGSDDGISRLYGSGTVAPLVNLNGLSHVVIQGLHFDIGAGPLPRGTLPPGLIPGGVMRLSDGASIEILQCRGGSRAPLGMGAGSNFINASRVDGLRIEDCVSWGARYHFILGHVSDLTVSNNTFVHSQIQSFIIGGKSDGMEIYNNIWYRPCGASTKDNPVYQFRGRIRDNEPRALMDDLTADHNLFYSPIDYHRMIGDLRDANRRIIMIGEDLDSWRSLTGLEEGSIRADPQFMDVAKGDFRLQATSPALHAGRGGEAMGARGSVLLPSSGAN